MIISEKALEIHGVFRDEIINYFIDIGGEAIEEGRFAGEAWEAEVGNEEVVKLSSIKIPSTMVTFRGEVELLDKMLKAFRLKFLKAGG